VYSYSLNIVVSTAVYLRGLTLQSW